MKIVFVVFLIIQWVSTNRIEQCSQQNVENIRIKYRLKILSVLNGLEVLDSTKSSVIQTVESKVKQLLGEVTKSSRDDDGGQNIDNCLEMVKDQVKSLKDAFVDELRNRCDVKAQEVLIRVMDDIQEANDLLAKCFNHPISCTSLENCSEAVTNTFENLIGSKYDFNELIETYKICTERVADDYNDKIEQHRQQIEHCQRVTVAVEPQK